MTNSVRITSFISILTFVVGSFACANPNEDGVTATSDTTDATETDEAGGLLDLSTIDWPECGDGLVEGIEECDDNDWVHDDECSNFCTLPACGDGILQAGFGEECDPMIGDNWPDDNAHPICTDGCQIWVE